MLNLFNFEVSASVVEIADAIKEEGKLIKILKTLSFVLGLAAFMGINGKSVFPEEWFSEMTVMHLENGARFAYGLLISCIFLLVAITMLRVMVNQIRPLNEHDYQEKLQKFSEKLAKKLALIFWTLTPLVELVLISNGRLDSIILAMMQWQSINAWLCAIAFCGFIASAIYFGHLTAEGVREMKSFIERLAMPESVRLHDLQLSRYNGDKLVNMSSKEIAEFLEAARLKRSK